ncbi:MAG: nitroreductase family protein [Gemmatimonadaceae bacterium]
MPSFPFRDLEFSALPPEVTLQRARDFYAEMNRRRTTRHFDTRSVPREAIELAIRTAGTAPSGAHQQPWTFVAVSDPDVKSAIRVAAEREEQAFYAGRAPEEWRRALAPLGTDANKPHLTDAPWVVVVFRHAYGVGADGARHTNYYTSESVGIAVGLFVAAIHHMGLVTLTHTPNPMGFLSELLQRPPNEKAYLILPVGYPSPDAQVPDIQRKSLDEIAVWRERP